MQPRNECSSNGFKTLCYRSEILLKCNNQFLFSLVIFYRYRFHICSGLYTQRSVVLSQIIDIGEDRRSFFFANVTAICRRRSRFERRKKIEKEGEMQIIMIIVSLLMSQCHRQTRPGRGSCSLFSHSRIFFFSFCREKCPWEAEKNDASISLAAWERERTERPPLPILGRTNARYSQSHFS